MHDISDEQYEKLQEILEKTYGKPCTFEEAKIIGDGFINIYTILLDGEGITAAAKNEYNKPP